MSPNNFTSRAGYKLDYALGAFGLDVFEKVCADFGCSTGGFTDCLLRRGAKKVYAVDTRYGVLDWHLRQDPRVICLERTNALHILLPELMDFISIDIGWTPQRHILPQAVKLLKKDGSIISLLKPHYESHKAHLSADQAELVMQEVTRDLAFPDLVLKKVVLSPITGKKAGNVEYLLWLAKI